MRICGELDNVIMLGAKIDALTSALNKMNGATNNNVESVQEINLTCELCGGQHSYLQCPSSMANKEDANFVGGNQRNFQPNNQWR